MSRPRLPGSGSSPSGAPGSDAPDNGAAGHKGPYLVEVVLVLIIIGFVAAILVSL